MEKERIAEPNGSFKEVSTDQQSSIEMNLNAKGEVSYKVKVYEDDLGKLEIKLIAALVIAEERKLKYLEAESKA